MPYIKDPDNTYGSELRNNYRYGLDRSRPSAPFFNSITVNQLHGHNAQSNFTSFTLINPMIASLRHDTLDQTSSNFLQNEMRIEYESVMYGRGLTAVDNPAGFADPSHYDVTPSPLTIAGGGVSNLFGAGGITEGISSVFSDLENGQVNLSTILTGFNTIQNIENYNDTNAAAEWQDIKDGVILAGTSALLNYAFNQPAGNTSLTQSQQVQDNSQTIFGLTRNDALNTLNTNQQARDDFAFRNVYFNSQQSGNLNDRKSSWNSLSRSQKNEFGQTAIDNFDNIRNAQ